MVFKEPKQATYFAFDVVHQLGKLALNVIRVPSVKLPLNLERAGENRREGRERTRVSNINLRNFRYEKVIDAVFNKKVT